MPRLHLLRSSYDLFVYGFPYDFFGIVGGLKLRRMWLHCLRSPYDFFRRQTRTKPYRYLADIVRRPQGCRAVIVLSSRPPYTNRTMPVRWPCGSRKESVLWLRNCRVSVMFIFWCTFEPCFKVMWCQSNKVAKIRNRYNQVSHLTQDTNGKVTNSQKTPQTRAKRSALSQHI